MERILSERNTARKIAAENRRKLIEENKENLTALASVKAVRTDKRLAEEDEKQQNKKKHLSIIQWVTEVNSARHIQIDNWNKPIDFRMITEESVHRYIPFEQQNVNLSVAFNYVKEMLAKYEPPRKKQKTVSTKTPLWYLSNNELRTALFRASIRRKQSFKN